MRREERAAPGIRRLRQVSLRLVTLTLVEELQVIKKKNLKNKVINASMMMHGARHAVSDSSSPKNSLSVSVDTKEDK